MEPLNVYACYNLDTELRLSSSSGAVFSSLAEFVLNKKGIVYGVAMSEDCYNAEYIAVTSVEELNKIRGSKYLQARVGDTFKQVKSNLLDNKLVLFSGTGCYVNGLKKYLGMDYANLICVDVICHGTPSPALWSKYVLYQERINEGKLKYINFRCKDSNWIDYGMKATVDEIAKENIKKVFIPQSADSYMRMFLRDYSLRPACYNCVAKKDKNSDLTIADFWGVENVIPDINDGKGISLVIIRSNKGQDVFNEIKVQMRTEKVSYEEGIRSNPSEYESSIKPIQRESFFIDMEQMEYEELVEKYATTLKVPFVKRIKGWIKKIFKYMLGIFRKRNTSLINKSGLSFVFECRR